MRARARRRLGIAEGSARSDDPRGGDRSAGPRKRSERGGAERVAERLSRSARSGPIRAPGYVLAGHGLYAWGGDPKEAWRHLEALETLFQQILALRSYRS